MVFDRRQFIQSVACLGAAACAGRARSPFPELVASGRPGDLGLAQGRAFTRQIRRNLDFYVNWLSRSGTVSRQRLLKLAGTFAPVLGAEAPEMLEEIDGIARGAGLALEEVLLINARTDLHAILESEQARSTAVPACTATALHGSRGGRPALALSQNWDWDTSLADAPVVLRLRPAEGPTVVTLVEAGMIGKIGFNERRLGVCLNFLSHVEDGMAGRRGVPIHCLLRAVLNSESLEAAVAAVGSAPRCASANFLLAQHDADGPRAVDLEITPDDVVVIEGHGRDLIHTNHFLDPDLAVGCTSGRGPSTMGRYQTAVRLAGELHEREPDPARRAEAILESRHGLPYPISRYRNPDPSSSTLAGIIMDLTDNRLLLTGGAPHREPWVELDGA